MDDTARLLQQTAARLFADHVPTRAIAEAERGTWPHAGWQAIEEAGLTRALVPEESGGFGLAVTDALDLVRLAGHHALPLPLPETMLAARLLAGAGLPIPEGPLSLASTLTLTRDGTAWRLRGTAPRTPWGRHATALAILATHQNTPMIALLRQGWHTTPGTNIAMEPRDTLAIDATLTSSDVAPAASGIDADHLTAFGAALRSLQIAGALARITAMTTDYAQTRTQFGRPIGKFQAIQHYIATMAAQSAAAGAAADLAAEAVAQGIRILPIAAAKTRTGEAAGLVAGLAHQIHGAIGFTYEHSLHLFTKRLWSWRDEFGNEATWSAHLGHHLARAGGPRLWAEITAV